MKNLFRRLGAGGALFAALLAAPVALATPTISITSPTNATNLGTVSSPTGVTINVTTAIGTSPGGTQVSSVNFLVNGTSIGTVSGGAFGAYAFPAWTPTAPGTYTLTAIVTDTSVVTTGTTPNLNTATSPGVTVTVAATRVATLTAPTAGAVFAQDSEIFFRAGAAMSDAVVARVDFYLDGTATPGTGALIATKAQAPYNAAVALTAANGFNVGSHVLRADAVNSDGSVTVASATTTINIAAPFTGNQPPVIALTAPSAGAFVLVNQNVTVAATATDADGFIPATAGAGVTFYVDGDPITAVGTGETNPDLIAPYSVTWRPTVAKAFSLRALTVDDKNAYVLSPAVTVTAVASLPTVAITAPANNGTLATATATTLTATATPSSGATVTSVTFFAGTTNLGTGTFTTGTTYSLAWTTPATAQAVALTAVVLDSAGITTTSAAITANIGTVAPTISITAPTAGATLALNTAAVLTASAAASGGATVNSVTFFAGTTNIGTGVFTSGTSYSFSWTPTSTGTFSITARVTDSNNATTTSSAVSVTVSAAAPTIAITSPTNGATIPLGTTPTLTANAVANSGATVSRVDFLAGATIVATALAPTAGSSYSATWTPTAAGITALTARVTDSNGTVVNSIVVNVNVTAPAVALTSPTAGSTVALSVAVPLTATATPVAPATITKVDFFAGTLLVGTANAAPYTVNWIPTATGATSLTARVTDSNNAVITSAAVSVTVATSAPTISITAPANGSAAAVGAATTVTATATATSGATVSRVDFLTGTTIVATTFSPVAGNTFSASWTPTAAGITALTARVTDTTGATATSVIVNINVNGPSVALTAPASGSSVTTGLPVTVTATAAATAPATIGRVDFFAGTTLVGTAGAAPYTISWTPTTSGTFSLTARATDSNGATVTSTAVSVTAAAFAPTISITVPSPGASVSFGQIVQITANAVANGGTTVQTVDFFVGATRIATVAGPGPYTVPWQPASVGTFSLTARVTDSIGATATSAAVSVTVTTVAAFISLDGPLTGSTFANGATVGLIANAAGANGAAVTRVDFLVGGAIVATATNAPYAGVWVPSATGTFSITARVTDANGTTATSTPAVVTVVAATRVASLTAPTNGSTLPVNSATILRANASFSDGLVARVDFYANGALLGTSATSPYFLATTFTTAGAYTLVARAVGTDGSTFESGGTVLNVVPAAGQPPTVGIVTPATGSFLPVGLVTTITGNSADADGTVTGVQVFANGTALGAATVQPNGTWTIAWTPSTIGAASLVAIASDNSSNSAASPTVAVNVTDSTSPTVSLAATPGTTTLPAGATRNILATAAASAGRAIVRVEFFVNGTKVGEKTAAPYNYRYVAPAATGTYVLSARATDNTGLASDAQLPLAVISPVGARPTISLLTPTNNSTVVPNTALSLAAAAVAPGGSVASVQFYANGSPAAINSGNPVVNSPYLSSFTPTTPGSYVLDAIATDDRGNTAVSNPITITAALGTPTIAMTVPNPNSNVTARATPTVPFAISVTATPGTGAGVILVEFLLDGQQIGTRTTPSTGTTYTLQWTPLVSQLGSHLLTARITDTNSQTATTTPAASLSVTNSVGTPPFFAGAISTTPVPAQGLQTASTVNFVANVTATGSILGTTNPNSLTRVEYFLNDVSIGTAAVEQATTFWRLAYDLSRYDFSQVTPDANTGRYVVPLYAVATDRNGNQTISGTTTLTISPSTSAAPTVTLTTPFNAPNNVTITQGTSLFLLANASDGDGTVSAVQLFANGTSTGITVNNPNANGAFFQYTPPAAGRYNLFVVATDDSGNTAVSNPSLLLNVTAVSAPNTAITRPTDNATVTSVGAPVFLEGTATSSDPTLTPTLQFIAQGTNSNNRQVTINGQRVGITTTYRAIFTPTIADTYSISTQATVSGVTGPSSASRTVVVNNVVGIGPTVSSVNFTPSTTQFSSASTAIFGVTATDADGAISSVEFFVNRNSIGQAVRDGVSNLWRVPTNFAGLALNTGLEVVAIARDNAGNLAASPTTNIAITAASSAAPTISISATPATVAFGQQVSLTANAVDADGSVSTVQYFVNGAAFATTGNAPSFTVTNFPTGVSGTFNVYAIATDNTGNTSISPTIQVTVKRNNPIIDDDAFIFQAHQDIVNRNPNATELATYGALIAGGVTTRAQLINTLATAPSTNATFNQVVNALAAYQVIMGQWPTSTTYATLFNLRGNLGNVVGTVLTSTEYILKYPEHVAPTTALLNNAASAIPADTFLARLWANAGLPGTPGSLDSVRFRSNDTANLTLGIGRGYNVVGLNTAVGEFVTNTNVNNTALFNSAKAAALFFMLEKPQVLVDTTNATAGALTIPAATARIAAIAALADLTKMAD
ncbi:MAG: hypothetical protein RLZZ15_1376, partial [Verrucomicrobiota bacterium]